MEERLQKFLSQAGIASRRHAEELIVSGKVKVNGEIVKVLGTKIDPDKDRVQVSNKLIKAEQKIYLIMNKPRRFVVTRSDPQMRKTVFSLLPPELKNKVWPVGRLDFQTEGLLVFTNDGELTQTLTHPSKEHEKEYEVILDREISEGKLEKIRNGMFLDGKKTAPAKARVAGKTIYMIIHEGWNRQIRKMFSELGYTVRNLKRIRIGKLYLNNLQLGDHRLIDKKEIL